MVTVPEIITAMAKKIATLPEVKAAHYPAPKTIPHGPTVVLYWGGDDDTVISNDLSKARLWLPRVMAQVLTPMKGNTPAEFATIDGLLTPITDLFDAGTVTKVLPSLAGKVDRLQVVGLRPSQEIIFAGHQFYGAVIKWDIKFHRRAGG